MKFNYILMNPPYDGNLHLKVLETAIQNISNICVNLSPVRWIQDPLAKYKKNTDFQKFEDSIVNHIKNMDIIKTEDANKLFGIGLLQPLGIYTLDTEIHKFELNPTIQNVFNKIVKYNGYEAQNREMYNDNLKNYVCVNIMAPSMKYGRPYEETLKNFGYFINGKNKDGLNYREAKAACKEATRGDVNKTECVIFETVEETINCWNAFQTKFAKWVCKTSVVDIHLYQKFQPWIKSDTLNPRTGKLGYHSDWINEDFKSLLNISDIDWEIINKE